MKKRFYFLFAAVVLFGVMLLPGCGGGGSEPSTDRTQLLTKGAWNIKSVVVDGVTKSQFAGLQVIFTSTGFTSTGGAPVWPASGKWSFIDASQSSFKRDDGTNVSITTLDENQLVLQLTWTKTTLDGGRQQSIAGQYTFTFGH